MKALISPMAMVAALSFGVIFPEFNSAQFLLRYLLIVMLFFAFLPLSFFDLAIRREHVFIVLANLAIGTLPFLLFKSVGWDFWALAAFFCGIMPTASAAPTMIGFLRGDVAFMFGALIFDNFCIALALLGLLPLFCGALDFSFVLKVAEELGWLLVLPWVASRIIRRIFPASRTKHFGKISFVLWLIVLIIVAAGASAYLRSTSTSITRLLELAAMSLFFCMLNFIGGRRLGGAEWKQETGQALGQKNTMLGIYLAITFATPLIALAPTFYTFWHNLWNACQLWKINRRRNIVPKDEEIIFPPKPD